MTTEDNDDFGPSRSQQRRDALAVLALAEQLMALPLSKLARIELPEDVLAEMAHVRKITAHGARKREMAYLAKLMRRHDDDVFDAARAELGEDRDRQRQESAGLHRLEAMRERLLDDTDDSVLAELIQNHPDIDRQRLRSLIRQARSERGSDKPPRAYRELFRVLKGLQDL